MTCLVNGGVCESIFLVGFPPGSEDGLSRLRVRSPCLFPVASPCLPCRLPRFFWSQAGGFLLRMGAKPRPIFSKSRSNAIEFPLSDVMRQNKHVFPLTWQKHVSGCLKFPRFLVHCDHVIVANRRQRRRVMGSILQKLAPYRLERPSWR